MNGQKSKLIRKIAKLTGRTDQYIKKQYKNMAPDMQRAYLEFMKLNLERIEDMRKNPPVPQNPDNVVLDQKIEATT